MANKKRSVKDESKGVIISGRSVTVHGDVVGRDKVANIRSGIDSGDMVTLIKLFSQIEEKIDQRANDPQVDKAELKNLVENIKGEVVKGEDASMGKVERWLRFLAEMADDIFQVTVVALTNPMAGVTKTIQLIAQKAKEKS